MTLEVGWDQPLGPWAMILLLNLELVFSTLVNLGVTQRTYKILMPGHAPDQLPRISGVGPNVCILGIPRWLQVWASIWQGQRELHNPKGGSLLGQVFVTADDTCSSPPLPPYPHPISSLCAAAARLSGFLRSISQPHRAAALRALGLIYD